MKQIFDLEGRVRREGGETVLGLKDLGTHACYVLFGVLDPGGQPRVLKPGDGHEEIILAISGTIGLQGPDGELTLRPGQAVYLRGEETRNAVCVGDAEARYVAAGGHTPDEGHDHHHHHHSGDPALCCIAGIGCQWEHLASGVTGLDVAAAIKRPSSLE